MKAKRYAALAAMMLALSMMLMGCVFASSYGIKGKQVDIGWSSRRVVRGSGEMVTREYQLQSAERLELVAENGVQVEYLVGEPAATLTMQENLFDYVTVDEKDGKVSVVFDRMNTYRFGSNKVPVLTLSAPTLSEVEIEGAAEWLQGDVIEGDRFELRIAGAATGAMDLAAQELKMEVAGASNVQLSGSADHADIGISGASDVQARDLVTQTADIRLAGAGNAEITCEQRLYVSISGVGKVSYWGEAEVEKSVSGMGTVEKK